MRFIKRQLEDVARTTRNHRRRAITCVLAALLACGWALSTIAGEIPLANSTMLLSPIDDARHAAYPTTQHPLRTGAPTSSALREPATGPSLSPPSSAPSSGTPFVAQVPAPPTDNFAPPPRTPVDLSVQPISSMSVNILPAAGQLPENADPAKYEGDFGKLEFERTPIDFAYRWEAPAFCNGPLYFEQPNLERYGYDWGLFQPFVSGAQFFVKIPLLPYALTVHHPREPIYSLGYYRPGSRVPYQINWPEVRLDAAFVEGSFITALVYLIP